jgi:TatD DNase family protein
MFIDTHCHITSDALYPFADALLHKAKNEGVDAIVNICTDISSLERGIKLKERYPWIYNTAATTPHDVEVEGELFFPKVREAIKKKHLVAIGETGLDYFYEHSNKALQQEFLSRYFVLAKEESLPLIFHCRDAFEDLFSMADEQYQNRPAVLHCFTGGISEARKVLDRGWYISLSGIVTFKKSELLREVAHFVPIDRLFIETDAPYLAPQSHRGKQNEPSFISETAALIAHVKNISIQELAIVTSQSAKAFFSF